MKQNFNRKRRIIKRTMSINYPFLCRHYNINGQCLKSENRIDCVADEGEYCDDYSRKSRNYKAK